MRVLPLAMTTLVLTAAIAAQRPAHLAAAWDQFADELGPQWQFDPAPGTGTPMDIWGPGLRLSAGPILDVDRARGQAAAVLQRFANVLGTGPTVFVEDIQAKTRQVWTFGYRQEYRGLPCITGRANVMINDVGVLAMFGSTALQIPANFDVTPRIALIQAQALAYQEMGVESQAPDMVAVRLGPADRLVVWGNAWAPVITAPRLAWEVRIDDAAQARVGRAYIDARTGDLLQFANDLHSCGFKTCRHNSVNTAKLEAALTRTVTVANGTPVPGLVNVVGNVKAWVNSGIAADPGQPKVNLPLENLRVEIIGGNSAFTDANGDFNIVHTGTTPVTITLQLQGRYCASVGTAQGTKVTVSTPATPGTPINIQLLTPTPSEFEGAQVNTYWATDHVNQFVRGRGGFTGPQLDQILPTANALATCNAAYDNYTMTFFNAGGGCANSAYPSVIYHEWGHGLDDANGGINQLQGLSEGSADFLSMAVLNDPRVGVDFSGPGTVERTGLNTKTFPVPPSAGLHAQGEPWMGWGWDVHLNLQRTLGTTAALSLYRDYAVGFFAANPGTQDSAVRAVFVIDDDDGDLTNGTPNCNSLAQACSKRNLTNPAICQGTPIFNVVGTGCPGNGKLPSACVSLNQAGGTLAPATGLAEYAFEAQATNAGEVVGFRLFTTASTTASSTMAHLYLQAQATSTPAIAPVAASSVLVGTTPGFYTATFATPISVNAGDKMFVSMETSQVLVSNITGGTPASATSERPRFGTGSWQTATSTYAPSYQILCEGGGPPGATPTTTNSNLPVIGTSFSVELTGARQNAPAFLMFGTSNTAYGPAALPFGLAGIGAPGCTLYTSVDIALPILTDMSGAASVLLPVPNNTWLVDMWLYSQFAIADSWNGLGLVFSDSGAFRIGMP